MNIRSTPKLTPDLDAATAFLRLLDPDAHSWTFQTFDDNADRKSKHLARVLHGTLEQHADTLADLQRQGAGVFVTVNETDGKGRNKSNITRARALFADLDGAPLDPPKRWLRPHAVVETSPDRWHVYWRTSDLPLQRFTDCQKALIGAFKSDKGVHDLPRVMRLPGFWHQKVDKKKGLTGTPYMVKVIEQGEAGAYPWAEMEAEVEALKPKSKPSPDRLSHRAVMSMAERADMAEVEDALSYVTAELPYDDWLHVLMALHHAFGPAGVELGERWSGRALPGEVQAKFKSFSRDGERTLATIFKMARDAGCDISELAKKHRGAKREARREQRAQEIAEAEIPAEAKQIARQIMRTLKPMFMCLADADPDIDVLIIRDMMEGSFWSGTKSRLFLLNDRESLNQHNATDAWRFLCRRFGSPVDVADLVEQEAELVVMSDEQKAKLQGAAQAAVAQPIIDHLKYHNQRDHVEWTVDMFAKESRIEMREDVVRVVLTHLSLEIGEAWEPRIIDDYRQHFPDLDSVIEFVVASRFALDRKKSYLWLLAESNWGKGFFLSVLSSLNLVAEMSVKEIEAIFEGKPSGRRPAYFKRAMILAVDEFKTVKSELKQLQSEIPLASKFELTSRVEIFTKLFLSAESVTSLVGEHGVEDQFANRMSVIHGRGSIESRPLYDEDHGRYIRSVKSYVAREINRLVAEYRSQGREQAERMADKFLSGFIQRHGLGQHFQRLSESVGEIAADAVRYFMHGAPSCYVEKSPSGVKYLTYPGKRLDDYFEERFAKSELSTIRRRKAEIMLAMSADGRGAASHKFGERSIKAIRLKA